MVEVLRWSKVKHAIIHYWMFLHVSFAFLMVCASALRAADDHHPPITMQAILDLKSDGANVFAFASASRELFVAHTATNRKLDQWNIEKKKLLHTYSCPEDQLWWAGAVVSPDGKLLVAATYPRTATRAKVLFINTQTHRIRHTEYGSPRTIKFDRSVKFIGFGYSHDEFVYVYDYDGKQQFEFNPKEFQAQSADILWDVPASKGGPPTGLFYKDANSQVHRLIDNPSMYALTKNGNYIGTSTLDQRVRVWRTFDLKEVFNQKIGAYVVWLQYDSKEDQFLVLDGMDGNTQLRAIKLPPETGKGKQAKISP